MTDRSQLIREARTRKGMTGLQVALLTQIDPSRISHIENGRAPVSEETIRRYLAAGLLTRDEAVAALIGPDDDTAAAS